MVKIPNTKIIVVGNSFYINVPKALIECEVLSKDKLYDVEFDLPQEKKVLKKEENSEVHNAPLGYSNSFHCLALAIT